MKAYTSADYALMDRLRTVRLRGMSHRWTVHVYDAHVRGDYGKRGLAWRVLCDGKLVASAKDASDLVWCPGVIDSDATVASVIGLVCHCASHDSMDRPVSASWDTEDLDDARSMRWSDF